MELTFRTAGIGDLELLTESRLRAIRTYRHLSETAALPHGLPDAVRDGPPAVSAVWLHRHG